MRDKGGDTNQRIGMMAALKKQSVVPLSWQMHWAHLSVLNSFTGSICSVFTYSGRGGEKDARNAISTRTSLWPSCVTTPRSVRFLTTCRPAITRPTTRLVRSSVARSSSVEPPSTISQAEPLGPGPLRSSITVSSLPLRATRRSFVRSGSPGYRARHGIQF